MKYKALIVDVDGTLVKNDPQALPSEKVKHAIEKAKSNIHVGIATSRAPFQVMHIIDHLKLSGPSIISGGAQIIEANTKNILTENAMDMGSLTKIARVFEQYDVPFIVQDRENDILYTKDVTLDILLGAYALNVSSELADQIIQDLQNIPHLNLHKLISWFQNSWCVSITADTATKQYGILEIAKILGIDTKEIIGIGDGYNDFPLLMACGLKVAMGNAVPELKAIADYIAPSVENDGLVDVIEQFVLR